MGEVYPESFAELRALVPGLKRGENFPAAYNRLLMSANVDLQYRAAQAWCAWEERLATLSGPPKRSARYGFARLVTHFFGNHAFLPPDGISGRLANIGDVPAVFVRGRLDIASPLGVSWRRPCDAPDRELLTGGIAARTSPGPKLRRGSAGAGPGRSCRGS